MVKIHVLKRVIVAGTQRHTLRSDRNFAIVQHTVPLPHDFIARSVHVAVAIVAVGVVAVIKVLHRTHFPCSPVY